MQNINLKKKELYEKNFNSVPSEEDKVEMRAYEYLTDNISNIIIQYKNG